MPGAVGLNVTIYPETRATAVHWLADGDASQSPLTVMLVGVDERGAVGSNVTSPPSASVAVHWLTDGHATTRSSRPGSTVAGVAALGAVGSNVTSCPTPSTAVHWVGDGHVTPLSWNGVDVSTVTGADHENAARAPAGAMAKAARTTTKRRPRSRGQLVPREIVIGCNPPLC